MLGLMVFLLVGSYVATVSAQEAPPEKIRDYIRQLQGKLEVARRNNNQPRAEKLQDMIDEQIVRLRSVMAGGEVPGPDGRMMASVRDEIGDLREEMNAALGELKGQIDKVEKEDKKEPKVSGVIYFSWDKPVEHSSSGFNKFGIHRIYLNFKQKLDAGASMRVTLDAGSSTLLKYAYFELPLLNASPEFPMDLMAKIGLQHTPWIDWVQGFWGNRYIAKVLLDNEGVASSADFGAGAHGAVTLGGMPALRYHGLVFNGTGYKGSETDAEKHAALRADIDLWENGKDGVLTLGTYGRFEDILGGSGSATKNKQAVVLVGYKSKQYGNVYGEYLYGSKSGKGISGYSVGGFVYPFCNMEREMEPLKHVALIGRFDSYNPDRSKSNDQTERLIYGASYDWGKNVKIAADVQQKTKSSVTSRDFSVHTQVKF